MDVQEVKLRYNPAYAHFGLKGDPTPHKQHQNQQRGLDLYVSVLNFETHEWCWKKLYENKKGLYFKHTGFSSMYIDEFTKECTFIPSQVFL